MDYPKLIVSNQKEESISIQRVNVFQMKRLSWRKTYVVYLLLIITLVLLTDHVGIWDTLFMVPKKMSQKARTNILPETSKDDPLYGTVITPWTGAGI